MKKCTKCGIDKTFELFAKDKRTKSGLTAWCRDCKKDCDKQYYEKAGRDRTLNNRYGISKDTYSTLMNEQQGSCAICGCKSVVKLCVDHNHQTGEVRGLLCKPCNSALGHLQDSPLFVWKAYQYLIQKGHYGRQGT